jgi:hypothetical protein
MRPESKEWKGSNWKQRNKKWKSKYHNKPKKPSPNQYHQSKQAKNRVFQEDWTPATNAPSSSKSTSSTSRKLPLKSPSKTVPGTNSTATKNWPSFASTPNKTSKYSSSSYKISANSPVRQATDSEGRCSVGRDSNVPYQIYQNHY